MASGRCDPSMAVAIEAIKRGGGERKRGGRRRRRRGRERGLEKGAVGEIYAGRIM